MSARQRGQVLPAGLLLLVVLILAWGQGHGLRQLANARLRLTHVVDAAAYSGALAQARALNLTAWLSRTQLAHQLALAHLATLAAWADFGSRQGMRQAQGNPPVFLIRRLFGHRYGQAYAAAAGAVTARGRDWAGDYLRHERLLHDVLEQARRETLAALPDIRKAAAQATATRNLATAESGLAALPTSAVRLHLLSDALPGSIGLRRAAPGHGTHAWLVAQARATPFLAPRQRIVRAGYPASPYCPYLQHELRRRGETRLDARGHWQVHDTLSFHAVRRNRWVGCYFRAYPMGWAWGAPVGVAPTARHRPDAPLRFNDQAFWRWVRARTDWSLQAGQDNPLALSYAAADPLRLSGRGLVPDAWVSARPLRFAIGLSVPAAGVLAAGAASGLSQPLTWHLPVLAARSELGVASAAATEYVHPDGRSGGVAGATLYLPYWQARLVPLTANESRDWRMVVR